MNKIKVCMPTYKRYDNLISLNIFDKNFFEVFLFVHDEEEKRKYCENYPNENYIITNAKSLTDQRNSILEHGKDGEMFLMVDDDIKGLFQAKAGELKRLSSKDIFDFCYEAISLCQKNSINLAGVYPIANKFYMSKSISPASFIIASFMIIKTSGIFFDVNAQPKEDYDFTMQHILRDRKVARFNYIAVEAGHFTNKGGLYEYRLDGEQDKRAMNYLICKYPKYIKKNPRRENEILMRFKK